VATYLEGLRAEQPEELARVNAPGLAALRGYLDSGQAVAFLGAGASAPLYPLWNGLIGELVDAAADRLTREEAATLRALASSTPESAVESVRRKLGTAVYREMLRQVLRVRTDSVTDRSWTPVQELVCRCLFKAVVTTNYDPGIVNARMRVRPGVSATGFTTWEDELELDRWRTGDAFGETELPVLYAHGQHNRPDTVVLATAEYQRAYAGKLPHVLGQLANTGHLVWIGFSFADQRIAAILREINSRTGTRIEPGTAPRHVAVMPWDPEAGDNDPGILTERARIEYGAELVLYPAPGGDHSALSRLLGALADTRFPPVGDLPGRVRAAPATLADASFPVRWVPEPDPVSYFTGRAEELAKLDRWAADLQVAVIGVTAWGGAGKTALVTRWLSEVAGTTRRPDIRGVFGWSFYAGPSAEQWADALLSWAREEFAFVVDQNARPAAEIVRLLMTIPLLLVLDGLEKQQEDPAGQKFGRLLDDGILRAVLTGACLQEHAGLVVLTSRFPFADLEAFDGGRARMLEVPPLTTAEGADLLAAVGGGWLPEQERRSLVASVDGHPLATRILAELLAVRLPGSDLATLRASLATATRTDERVGHVLGFYSNRLHKADRYLLAAVSLFARPAEPETVLTVAKHEAFGSVLAGWTPAKVRDAVRGRLSGLASWHRDGTISAHPLVRDAFRPLALDAAGTVAEATLGGLPGGAVTNRDDALRVVEVIELLLEAGQWQAADDMYDDRCDGGEIWKHLPAAGLGRRAAEAFVGIPDRQTACTAHLGESRTAYYLNWTGMFMIHAGDPVMASGRLRASTGLRRKAENTVNLSIGLVNLASSFVRCGETGQAREAAAEALTCAETLDTYQGPKRVCNSQGYLAWIADIAGDISEAEQRFAAVNQFRVASGVDRLNTFIAALWADYLARTGRPGAAADLIRDTATRCQRNAWNDDTARCDRVLGRLALAADDALMAGKHLTAAATVFRDGDYLAELAYTLPDLAECALLSGNLDEAGFHADEAINIAATCGLAPAHSAALAVRARIRASQAIATGNPDLLHRGRDDADAALRIATVHHQLPWCELDALRARARLDGAEDRDQGWAAKADALHKRLVPPELDPDPLGTSDRE